MNCPSCGAEVYHDAWRTGHDEVDALGQPHFVYDEPVWVGSTHPSVHIPPSYDVLEAEVAAETARLYAEGIARNHRRLTIPSVVRTAWLPTVVGWAVGRWL